MSDIFTRGHKCMFKGQKIVGDGQHTREQLYLKVMAAKPQPVKPRGELRKGEKAMHKGQPVIGDGESTSDELYDKLMAGKKPKKRGLAETQTMPKVTEPEAAKPKKKKKK